MVVISSYLPEILGLSDRILVSPAGQGRRGILGARGDRGKDHVRGDSLMSDSSGMKTTRAVRDVITIADIEALEGGPYDELIPARTLIDLLRATAHLHPDRPAITTMPAGGFSGRSSTISHRDLYRRTVRAANLFHESLDASGGGTVAFLGPIVEGMMEALLGAQTAGVASTINYLLSAEVIADLLAAENATVLVLSPSDADAAMWQKAQAVVQRAKSLRHIVVLGDASAAAGPMIELSRRRAGTGTMRWSSSRGQTAKRSVRSFIPGARPDGPSSCA